MKTNYQTNKSLFGSPPFLCRSGVAGWWMVGGGPEAQLLFNLYRENSFGQHNCFQLPLPQTPIQ